VGELRADLERAELWLASVRAYHEKRQRENVAAWYAFHMEQAERIQRTASALISEHREKAEALLEDQKEEGCERERNNTGEGGR
jgi:hypothetical protein